MAPPTGGHYRPTLSNPYNQYPQQQHTQYQQQNSYNAQSFDGHGGFAASQANHNMNIFAGGGLQNGAQTGNFGTSALQGPGGTGLASHEAQMRFAHGAALQRQGDDHAGRAGVAGRIREVWANNMNEEFKTIRALVDRYPYISMDTEFPGIVARPMGHFQSKADYHYQTLRCNVDFLKLIQLGITLWSPEGELPPATMDGSVGRELQYSNNMVMCPCTWTFNFKFSLKQDMSSASSIELLKKAGVDFEKCATMGIDPKSFGARLTDSGLVLNDDVTWLSFHSGYDFGYLVKLVFPALMKEDDEAYLKVVKQWFRNIYDIKYLLRVTQNKIRNGTLNQQATDIINGLGAKSGLQDLANELGCQREGMQHTAGSDAWLTGAVFWAMRSKIFEGQVPAEHLNKIWGLSSGTAATVSAMAGGSGETQTPLHTAMTPTTYRSDNPSTPKTSLSGPAQTTPGQHHNYQGSMGLTGGAFNFQYGNR